VTLTGVGGVGKTRLALQVGANASPGFTDGVWLCELAAASSHDELVQVVAIALGVVQRAQMSMAESIIDFLRPRYMLVVLDNCEHLLDAAAELVQAVLAGALGVRVLATSREGLGVPGEHLWPLRSLALPSGPDAAGSDAVLLFAERARAAAPDFVLDDVSTPGVVEVCRRLDGIPLAIELAAARVAALTPAEIAGHLDERFRLLTGGRRGRVERHQTLRAAVEWSYALLEETERMVFDRLGVFPASFDQAAAVAVCVGDGIERWDVIDGLSSLVAKSMVGVERSGDATRYQLLETLRHFARDRAGVALEGLRRRHANHYAEFAMRAGAGLMSADELAWRPRLASELDNLRAACGWAFDADSLDDVPIGARIIDGLLVEVVNQPSWGIQAWATAALRHIDQLEVDGRSAVLAVAAWDALFLGQFDRAQALGGSVIAEANTLTPAVFEAFCAVSVAKMAGGDLSGAKGILTEARRRLHADEATEYLVCASHNAMAPIAYYAGDGETARTEADQGVADARRIGSPTLLALALYGRALALSDLEPDQALAAAQESIELVDSGAGNSTYGAVLQIAAALHTARGDIASAASAIRAAVAHEARVGGSRIILVTLIALAAQVLATRAEGVEAAAALSGAVTGPLFGPIRLLLRGPQLERYQQTMADLAVSLGAETHGNAQHDGATMDTDTIINFTLSRLAALSVTTSPSDSPSA